MRLDILYVSWYVSMIYRELSHVLILDRMSNISAQGLLMLRLSAQRCVEPRSYASQPDLRTQSLEACIFR
jgi:thymidylate synthase ThyX